MCLYPKLIKNRKYISNKKNRGNVPVPADKRVLYVAVGCQKCMECKKQKARNWQIRLQEELRTKEKAQFVTLTFSTESLKALSTEIQGLTGYNLDNAIATKALRLFNERWRKKHKKAIKHWFVTELGHGETEHLHMHGIVWTNESRNEIEQKWQYGYIWPRKDTTIQTYVNEKTVNYLIKYVTKQDKQHEYYNPIILTSPGIGKTYTERYDAKTNKFSPKGTKEYYITRTGHKISLPVYWRNKIYTEEEREKLWIEKLDKLERWVLGQKIDISKGEETYYKALKEAQEKNTRLGYGNDKIDWEKKKYENQRRELKMAERAKRPADSREPSPARGHRPAYKEN